MTALAGCDTSNNNHGRRARFDFGAAADASIAFAYLKCTEGLGFADGYYRTDLADATAAGLHAGAYHFARPDTGAGAGAEGLWFNSHKGTPSSTWLDLERGLPQLGAAGLAAWALGIQYACAFTGWYWNESYRAALLPHLPSPLPWLQWVADPSTDTWPSGAWVWQYGMGAVPGIGVVDLNRSIVLAA